VPPACSPVRFVDAGRMSGGAAESESDSVPDTGAGALSYLASNISGISYISYVCANLVLPVGRTNRQLSFNLLRRWWWCNSRHDVQNQERLQR
jgi:hypothetical protein